MSFNKFTISDSKVINLLNKGMKYYESSYDQHKKPHINRILNLYSEFPKSELAINENAMLLSIVWHDVYKASRVFSKNRIYFLFQYFYEGFGSAKIFRENAKVEKLSKEIIYITNAVIKHHPQLEYVLPNKIRFLYPRRTRIETLLLRDLDLLESSVSLEMLNDFKESWFPIFRQYPSYNKLWQKMYFNGFEKISEDYFVFDWCKENFRLNRDPFLQKANLLLNEMKEL